MRLKLLEFIKNNANWEDLLSSPPYSLSIKRDGDYVLFMYSMIDSDLSLDLVQEARGIIFNQNTWDIVCFPFKKFFNVQESNASDIDWTTAVVQEKIDGSILKLWNDGKWHLSTNGTINAVNAQLSMPVNVLGSENDDIRIENYLELFLYAVHGDLSWLEDLDTSNTYIFEIVSPYNRIVVPYVETEIYHIGTRNNKTFEEMEIDIGIEKPKVYPLFSLSDCMKSAEGLPYSEEGYVVVDANWNRVKIKSPNYVSAHYLRNNGNVSFSSVLEMIMNSGQDDFLSIYPEYTETFKYVENSLSEFVLWCEKQWEEKPRNFETRKDFASWATKTSCPPVMFSLYDKKFDSVKDWLYSQQTDKILSMIGVK